MRTTCSILFQCVLLLCIQSVSAATIEMVTVGNPGNAPDPCSNPFNVRFGAVSYIYQIGKYEVTNAQYTEFLNAVAKADPYQLYELQNIYFGSPAIQRSGSSPNYSYSIAPALANRPVAFVSPWDAARFCNWLHNGQPTGPEGPGTTEDGAYHDIGDLTLFGRNPDARFFLPTNDEWYKAAYHNSAAALAADYFKYPTRSNTEPGRDVTEMTNPGNNADFAGLFPGTTDVGEFELSIGPYGTYDQGGNVWEFTETLLPLSGGTSSAMMMRGGCFFCSGIDMSAANGYLGASPSSPGVPYLDKGFRIAAASVPEPICLSLFSITAVMLEGGRMRTRRGKSS